MEALHREQGAPDAQLDALLKIVEVESSNIEVLQQILELYDSLGNVRDSREMRERMIRLHLDRKEYIQALAICRSALERDADDAGILETCVDIHQKTHNDEQLREDAFRLVELYKKAGFAIEMQKTWTWSVLPTPRNKLHSSFTSLTDEELLVSAFRLTVRPM